MPYSLQYKKVTYERHGGFGSNKRRVKSNNTEKVFRCCVPATWPSQGNHSLHGDGTSNPDSNSLRSLFPTFTAQQSIAGPDAPDARFKYVTTKTCLRRSGLILIGIEEYPIK